MLFRVMFIIGALFFGFVGAALIWATVRDRLPEPFALLYVPVFASVWLGFVWRMSRIGLFVGVEGIQIRGVLRTRVVSWHDITGFEIRPPGHVPMIFSRGEFLWVILKDGRAIEAPVQRRQSLGQMAMFSIGGKHTGQTILRPERFDGLLADLRRRLATLG